jgi:hypothetical protein
VANDIHLGLGSPSRMASSPCPSKILKTESAFAQKKSPGKGNSTEKKIVFADEIGDSISESIYVEQLHYSPASNSPTEAAKTGCSCVIS